MGNEQKGSNIPPWSYRKPRSGEETPFVPRELGDPRERALAGLSSAVTTSEGINTLASERQKALLRSSAENLKTLGLFQVHDVIVDGQATRQGLFIHEGFPGVCVDLEGNIRFYHRPSNQQDPIVVDLESSADETAITTFAPRLIRAMRDLSRQQQAPETGETNLN